MANTLSPGTAELAGTAAPQRIRTKRGIRWGRIAAWGAMGLLIFISLFPFYWMLRTALSTNSDLVTGDQSLVPPNPTLLNLKQALGLASPEQLAAAGTQTSADVNFFIALRNSIIVCTLITIGQVTFCSMSAYAFARLKFPGRELLFLLVLGTIMVPDQLRLIPVFVMLTNWHLIGNFSGYILINLVTATNLFFMRQYFLTIPKDFEEAAKLDGAGYFKTFWRIMLPLALPAISALVILQFQGTWNDFFWPLILFGQGNPAHYTIQLGLAELNFQYGVLWPEICAGSIIAILPILAIFLAFQRYFISGVVSTGVKG